MLGALMVLSAAALPWVAPAGDSTAMAVKFTAEGGTISTSGVYTAGSVPGTYRLIASTLGGRIADTAMVTVASAVSRTTLDWRDVSAACGLLPVIGVKCEKPHLWDSREAGQPTDQPARREIGFDPSLLRLSWSTVTALLMVLGLGGVLGGPSSRGLGKNRDLLVQR